MRHFAVLLLTLAVVSPTAQAEFSFDTTEDYCDIKSDGKIWLRTMTAPFDRRNREETYKVFTQVYDFEGEAPITKGAGGKYTHHRGLFIGWNHTHHAGETYDTWHMKNCYQQHVSWETQDAGEHRAWQVERVDWNDRKGNTIIEETRTIVARPQGELRVIDFASELTAVGAPIELRGDLQHAGMQIRMANEVSEHPESTEYILPEGAEELDDDKVVGAWWVCGSVVVRDERYWVMHMTSPNLLTGEPVYSIRDYARFGAFFEPDIPEGDSITCQFRIVVSKDELTREDCQALYDAYAESMKEGS